MQHSDRPTLPLHVLIKPPRPLERLLVHSLCKTVRRLMRDAGALAERLCHLDGGVPPGSHTLHNDGGIVDVCDFEVYA